MLSGTFWNPKCVSGWLLVVLLLLLLLLAALLCWWRTLVMVEKPAVLEGEAMVAKVVARLESCCNAVLLAIVLVMLK